MIPSADWIVARFKGTVHPKLRAILPIFHTFHLSPIIARLWYHTHTHAHNYGIIQLKKNNPDGADGETSLW